MRRRRKLEVGTEVIIIKIGLEVAKDMIFLATKYSDDTLIQAMDSFINELKGKNVEIFLREKNIIITENGYYISVYPKDLVEVKE
jgi:hypothetical protein